MKFCPYPFAITFSFKSATENMRDDCSDVLHLLIAIQTESTIPLLSDMKSDTEVFSFKLRVFCFLVSYMLTK